MRSVPLQHRWELELLRGFGSLPDRRRALAQAAALSRLSKEGDDLLSLVARWEAAIRLHAVAGYDLIGVCNEAIKFLLIPDEAVSFIALENP